MTNWQTHSPTIQLLIESDIPKQDGLIPGVGVSLEQS